jgi:ABC-2 type transport system permease protein
MDMKITWDKLYGERLRKAYRTGIRYTLLAISGNNLFGILLLLVGTALGYRFVLDWMKPSYGALAGMAAIYAGVTYSSHVRTFLRSADMALLLPTPYPMMRYINHALGYSLVIQCVQASIWTTLLWPAVVRAGGQPASLIVVLIGAAALKVWSVWMHWCSMGHPDRSLHSALHNIWRYLLLIAFWYGLLSGIPFISITSGVFMLINLTLVRHRPFHVPWLRLIEAERKRIRAYYTWLNWFVDIPYAEPEVQPRKVWVRLWDLLFRQNRSAMLFLLARSWVRTGDEFGMFVRMTAFASILLAAIGWPWAIYLIYIGTPLIAGYLMVQWARRTTEPSFVRIMPIDRQQKRRAFAHLCSFALILQMVILTLCYMSFHGVSLRGIALFGAVMIWCLILGRLIYPRKVFLA